MDSFTNVYVADTASNLIFKITPAGVRSSYLTNNTSLLNSPSGIVAVGSNLYVANTNDTIIAISPQGSNATVVAGLGLYAMGSADVSVRRRDLTTPSAWPWMRPAIFTWRTRQTTPSAREQYQPHRPRC